MYDKEPLIGTRLSLGQAIVNSVKPCSGDWNALFGVILDNIANLTTMYGILVGFGIPADFIYSHMFAGPAFAVLLGNLMYVVHAIYLYKRDSTTTDDRRYTAIPLGLDAPSTIGLPLLVVGPAFLDAQKRGLNTEDAANNAWQIGCATVFLIGLIKVLLSFMGFVVEKYKLLHPVGQRGALAGIGFSLLGVIQFFETANEPVVGMAALWVIILLVIEKYDDKGRIGDIKGMQWLPGVAVSAAVGMIIYYIMAPAHLSKVPMPENLTSPYYLSGLTVNFDIFSSLGTTISNNISIAIPYAFLVYVGGTTISKAAMDKGNDYHPTLLVGVDAACTVVGSLLGSITQTTPYIGHGTYYDFGARSFYSIISGVFVGLGGMLGYISLFSKILPRAAMAPIFILVAYDICKLAFYPWAMDPDKKAKDEEITTQYTPAIIMAIIPTVAQLISIVLSQLAPDLMLAAQDPAATLKVLTWLPPSAIPTVAAIVVLSHGFIATGLLWGSAMAFLIDGDIMRTVGTLLVCGVLAAFGVIHSVDPNGKVYLPSDAKCDLPYQWLVAYVVLAGLTVLWALVPKARAAFHEYNLLRDTESVNYTTPYSSPYTASYPQ